MATPVDPQTLSVSGREKRHVRFVEVSPRDEDQKDVTEECGAHLSVWSAGLFISKWRSAQRRGVRARLYTDDPEYRRVLREQELQLRSTVPLPLASAMDQETLHILLDVEKSYRRSLGPHHALTADAQRRIQTLRDRRSARGVREEPETSTWSRWTPFRRDIFRRAQSPETEMSETETSVLNTWSRWTPFRRDRRAQSPETEETETSVLNTWSRWTPFRRDIFRRAQSPDHTSV
ncbi:uncharacterized protein LOC132097284 isoform X2 [Carassius carassius]|uniref:uncharacterized protein LOC132097284 isoform X2 n=1 Tax=Carassius carassius TaxID=217509 RepID=UPI002868589D|nr:uncharacterized protein LOC132097284 isoform X2 [Carassius carassius]